MFYCNITFFLQLFQREIKSYEENSEYIPGAGLSQRYWHGHIFGYTTRKVYVMPDRTADKADVKKLELTAQTRLKI